MDKRIDDFAAAMRELARQRDCLLREVRPAISVERIKNLHAVLACELPAEAALRQIAKKRDGRLGRRELVLPSSVEAELSRRLTPLTIESRRQARPWVDVCLPTRLLLSRQGPAIAAAILVLAAGTLHFVASNVPLRAVRNPDQATAQSEQPEHPVQFIPQVIRFRPDNSIGYNAHDHLTLRVSKIELASLRSSSLPFDRMPLRDLNDWGEGLPLDLPTRPLFVETEPARTP